MVRIFNVSSTHPTSDQSIDQAKTLFVSSDVEKPLFHHPYRIPDTKTVFFAISFLTFSPRRVEKEVFLTSHPPAPGLNPTIVLRMHKKRNVILNKFCSRTLGESLKLLL
jgi:hypothetical protein